jgi:hypothetical protein
MAGIIDPGYNVSRSESRAGISPSFSGMAGVCLDRCFRGKNGVLLDLAGDRLAMRDMFGK